MLKDHYPIYLDYAATTPVDPLVADSMIDFLKTEKNHGNPSATSHIYGKIARKAVEEARNQVARLINAEPEEILWTSGTTEAINIALKGVSHFYQKYGKHIITVATEHKAVLEVCRKLQSEGFLVSYLPCNSLGLIDPAELKAVIRTDTILISVMHVNNETGVIQDINTLSDIAQQYNILFHLDAAQSIGKLPIDVKRQNIDLISLSSHKIYGPKGIGALYIKASPKVFLLPQMDGGGQENGLRSGTLPTHQIVGMGKAYEIAEKCLHTDYQHCLMLQQEMLSGLKNIEQIEFNTPIQFSIPNILNLSIKGIKNILFINKVKEIAISSGSACSSGSGMSSYVLEAMQLDSDRIANSIRISWGRFTSRNDIRESIHVLDHALSTVTKLDIA